MVPIFPSNKDSSRFGNKYKSLLSCVATGITTYANELSEFQELLAPEAFAPVGTKGHRVGTWRLLVLQQEESLLDSSFQDKYPERFDTTSQEVSMMYSRRSVIDGFYHKIPKEIQKRILIAQTWIPWNPKMNQILTSIPLLHRVVGVSVRTWRAKHDTCALSAHRAKSFNVQKYLDVIAKFENKVEAIFFSYDTPEAEELFKDVKIPRMTMPSSDLTPMQQACLKAKILGSCGVLIGDRDSTFIEAAWWLGECRADVILL
jgi:hypothetical protein